MIGAVTLCGGMIYFAWSTLGDIQQHLPLTVVRQQHDIALLLQDVASLAAKTGLAEAAPSPSRIEDVLDQAATVERRLEKIRGTYNFDNLVGASAMHAVISPAATDITRWLEEGVYGLPPDSPAVIALVNTRVSNAIATMRSMYSDAQWKAFDALEQQSHRIQDFKNIIVVLLLILSTIIFVVIFQTYRLRLIGNQLRLAKETAEQASKAKSDFLAHMSHELRSPLNSIIGFSQMMSRRLYGTLSPKYAEYALDIQASAQHLLEVVSDILDITRVESGAVELHEEVNEVWELMQTSKRLATFHDEFQPSRLRIVVPPDFPMLRADTRLVRQILINLVSNAVKFAPEGPIELRAELDRDGAVLLRVADEGIGIAPADIPKVLTPFGQVRPSQELAHPGTGLGLSLSKSFAELHGGSLTIVSELGAGTTVTVRFPAERTVPQAPWTEPLDRMQTGCP